MIGTRLDLAYSEGILSRILENPYAVAVVWLMRVFATYKKKEMVLHIALQIQIDYSIVTVTKIFKNG